jgi:replicative DNA helicase
MVKPEYFEVSVHSNIFKVVHDHYFKYTRLPTDSQILEEVKDLLSDNEYLSEYKTELEFINKVATDANANKEYLIDKVEVFARRQSMTEALYSSVEHLKANNYDKVFETIKKALNVGRVQNLGALYSSDGIDARYERLTSKSNNIGLTPFKELNAKLDDGGLSRGELAMVIAPTGVGKSMYLVNQAARSAKDGLNVLYISLEMSEDRLAQRLDSVLTRIPIGELKNRVNEIKYRLQELEKVINDKRGHSLGKIKIKQFPGRMLTISSLRAYIQQLYNYENFTPDVLIIDYLDEMGSTNEKTYEAHQENAQSLRGLAVELKCLVWTATQTNREAHKVEVITEREVGDSYGKLRPCEFIFSINQTPSEADKGVGRLYIMKNRNGISKIQHPIRINKSIMLMEDLPLQNEQPSENKES